MPIDLSNLPIEVEGSPSWDWDLRGYVGRREWLCLWEDISDPLMIASWVPIPYVTLFDLTSGMICTKISASPIQSTDGSDNYLVGRLTADYSTSDFLDGTPQKRCNGCVESLVIGEGRTYDDDSSPCSVGMTMTIYTKRLQVSFLRDYASTLVPAMDSMVNKVNNSTFEGYAAGHVLMEPYDYDEFVNPGTGNVLQRVTLNYLCRPSGYGHNYFYNASTATWTTTTPLVYASTSFAGLYT